MRKHYPGPWRVFISDAGRVWVETADGLRLVVADIPGDMETIDGEELANANLIAAAPDLLTACEAAARWFDPRRARPQSVTLQQQETERILGLLRAAVKDATEGKEHTHE